MSFSGADLHENDGIPFGDLSTDLFAHRIDTGVKPDASIFCRADEMVHQDGNIMALLKVVCPPNLSCWRGPPGHT